MALIKCSECGQMVSDRAESCPKCGNPIAKSNNTYTQQDGNIYEQENDILPKKKSRKNVYVVVVVLLLALLGGGLSFYFTKAQAEPTIVITEQFANKIRKYDKLGSFHEGLALVQRNGLWGYIDAKGDEVIPCIYKGTEYGNYGFDFSEGMAVIIDKNGKYGYINTKGEVVIKPQFQQAGSFSESVASVFLDGKLNFIGKDGKYIEELSNKFIWDFNMNRNLPQFKNGVCEVHIPAKEPSEGVIADIIYIDKNGNQIEKPEEVVKKELYVRYYEGEKVGYKDSIGNIIVPAKYTTIGDFSCGVAVATLEYGQRGYGMEEWYSDDYVSIYGYVDLNGNETFKKQDYSKIEQAKVNAEMQKEKEKNDRLKGPQWIDGSWFFEGNVDTSWGTMFMSSQLVIDRNAQSIKTYSKGELTYNGKYSITENEIRFEDTYIVMDANRQLLKFSDELYYSKGEPSSTNRAEPNSESQDNLLEYEKEIRERKQKVDKAYRQFQRDRATGRYYPLNPPQSYYDLMKSCSALERSASKAKRKAKSLGRDDLADSYEELRQWAIGMQDLTQKALMSL